MFSPSLSENHSHILEIPKRVMMAQKVGNSYLLLMFPSYLLSQKQDALMWKPLVSLFRIMATH